MTDSLADRLAEHADNIRWDAENSVTVPLLDEAVDSLREKDRIIAQWKAAVDYINDELRGTDE